MTKRCPLMKLRDDVSIQREKKSGATSRYPASRPLGPRVVELSDRISLFSTLIRQRDLAEFNAMISGTSESTVAHSFKSQPQELRANPFAALLKMGPKSRGSNFGRLTWGYTRGVHTTRAV